MSDSSFPDFNISLPDLNALAALSRPLPSALSWAPTQFEIIRKYVLEFQSGLDDTHDVGLLLTNFGSSILMEVTEIGYEESVLMVFKGFVNGTPSTLIQHVSQLNFLLTTVPKQSDVPHRTIGFTAE